jgi:hypothetical protein
MADLGKLLRLKQTADAAAQVAPTPRSASVLQESYNRVRTAAGALASELGLDEEFNTLFRELGFIVHEPRGLADSMERQNNEENQVAAETASSMLAQLAGWIDGLIAEQTLEARIRAEAEARAQQESKRVGF